MVHKLAADRVGRASQPVGLKLPPRGQEGERERVCVCVCVSVRVGGCASHADCEQEQKDLTQTL